MLLLITHIGLTDLVNGICEISQVANPFDPTTIFSLAFDVQKDEVYPMRRRRCDRSEYATGGRVSADKDDLAVADIVVADKGGWRWEWFL